MGDELTRYYEIYHTDRKDEAYCMSKTRDSSRVRFLKGFVELHTPKGGRVLDVGCGDMYLSTQLPDYDWHGVDIQPLCDNPKAKKHDLMVIPYPFEAGSFDTIICSEVLEHLWDLRIVNREVRRLLKPGGKYIMSTPNFDHIDYKLSGYREILFTSKFSHEFEHIRHYNLDQHLTFLNEARFKTVSYVGADAHFSKYFKNARNVLHKVLNANPNTSVHMGEVDQILGSCFPDTSHTIMVVSEAI